MRSFLSLSKSGQFGVTRGRVLAEFGVWAKSAHPLVRVNMRYEGAWGGGEVLSATYCFIPVEKESFWQSLEVPYDFVELLVGSRRASSGTFHFDFLFGDGSHKSTSLDLENVLKLYRGRGERVPKGVKLLESSRAVADAELSSLDAAGLLRKSEELIEQARKEAEERQRLAEEKAKAEREAKLKAQQAAASKQAPAGAPAAGAAPAPAADFDPGGAKVGIFYGSTTGNTAGIAEAIKAEFDDGTAMVVNVTEIGPIAFTKFEYLVLGVPTWHIGEMQEDWAELLPKLEGTPLKGKKCAIFGLGDGVGYADTYVDAMEELWGIFKPLGAELVGLWPTEGYIYEKSKAILDGKFMGLVIDIENQNDQSEERVKKWTAQIRAEMSI